MKVKPSVKKICDKCKVIRRHGRVMVICENPATSSARAEQAHRAPGADTPTSHRQQQHPTPRPGTPERDATPGRRPGTRCGPTRERCCGETSATIRERDTWHASSASTFPREKRLEIALTYIYGVGRTRAKQTLAATGVSPDLRVRDLGDEELVSLRDYIEGNFKVEGDLRREVAADIRRKVEIGCYQGLRHRRGLPVRGQRTKTNARTRKGPKRTVAGKKKAGQEVARTLHAAPTRAAPPRPATGVTGRCHPRHGSSRRGAQAAPQGEEERRPRARSHQEHVQQHDRLDHRPDGQRDLLGLRRPGRLQGFAQVHPVRGADGRRGCRAPGAWSTACARSTSSSRAPAPVARPRSAPCRPPAWRSARSRT